MLNIYFTAYDESADILEDNLIEVESGVEALEESNIDVFGDISQDISDGSLLGSKDKSPIKRLPSRIPFTPNRNNENKPPEKSEKPKTYFFTFFMSFLTIVFIISYILFPRSHLWNGFVLGLLVYYIMSVLKQWVLDTYFCEWESDKSSFFQVKRSNIAPITFTIPSVKEHRPLKKYEVCIAYYIYKIVFFFFFNASACGNVRLRVN